MTEWQSYYRSPRKHDVPSAIREAPEVSPWLRKSQKIILCAAGLLLYSINPWRDLIFYREIAAHEGLGTMADTYFLGVVWQSLATILFFPVALFLIVYGIGSSSRLSFLPRFDRITVGWGALASVLAVLMLLVEADYVLYGIAYPHHYVVVLLSLLNILFIYGWWCCSISHGGGKREST